MLYRKVPQEYELIERDDEQRLAEVGWPQQYIPEGHVLVWNATVDQFDSTCAVDQLPVRFAEIIEG
jgi:hypothetical protein